MATIAGGVMAAYIQISDNICQSNGYSFAGRLRFYLLLTCLVQVYGAPAGLLISKIYFLKPSDPETKVKVKVKVEKMLPI